jgi:sporadic carbohydrate cluster 2OG-Fe(II) oxygenase
MNINNLIADLRDQGLVIFPNQDLKSWHIFKKIIDESCESFIEQNNNMKFDAADLNDKRMEAFRNLNAYKDWDKLYYKMAENLLDTIFGPDLLIQRKLNLSIQMPEDESSILAMHADTLSGQSPFELVMWTAFTNASESNSMFYFDRETSKKIFQEMPSMEKEGLEELRKKYWKKARFVDAKESDIVLFSGTLFHGNTVNKTENTRISINCRFKNLFSPAGKTKNADRGVGIFYKLLHESVVTEIGREYLKRDITFEI